jgi:flagellar biosynthetic protein FliR
MDLAALSAWFEDMPSAILVFARVAGLFLAGPVIGESFAPIEVKVLLSMAVTAIIAPLAQAHHPAPLALDALFVVLLLKETMVGVSLGFIISLYVQGVRFGGDLLNRHAGFSAAENFDPQTLATTSPLGDIMMYLVMLLFFASNGHHFFFAALVRSYEIVPGGDWRLTSGYMGALAHGMNDLSTIAVTLSFPVLTAIMAITFAEGVITRAVPQINIMHISFTVKIMVSLLVLYTGLPTAVVFLGAVLTAMQEVGYASLRLM